MNGSHTITDDKPIFDPTSSNETITQHNTSSIMHTNHTSQKHDGIALDDHITQTISAPTKKLRKRDIVLIALGILSLPLGIIPGAIIIACGIFNIIKYKQKAEASNPMDYF